MPFIKRLNPAPIKRRQYPPRFSLTRIPSDPPHRLEVLFEIRVDNGEGGRIPLGSDAVLFPFPLLRDRGEVCFSSEHAGGEDGLPLEDFEG